jgi:hypothetical protein
MTLSLTWGPDFLLTVSTTHLDFGNFLTCTTSCSLGIHAAPVSGWDSALTRSGKTRGLEKRHTSLGNGVVCRQLPVR